MTHVYRFSKEVTDGNGGMKNILGGKGAGLAEMCRLGIPVPPGFTISTGACLDYLENGISDQLQHEVAQSVTWLEGILGKSLFGEGQPLLLSVRSGARVSMPGMMDTVLNLGLTSATVERLAEITGQRRFAYDSYRRFIQMYSNVVLGLDHHEFESRLEEIREAEGAKQDKDISVEGLMTLVDRYKEYVLHETDQPFPDDPMEQLWGSIRAVFDSWNNPRAKFYRKINNIGDNWGTAVNVQSMVFGNMGENSGTGVCFTRDPATGEPVPYGEFLVNAQGEDVVAGIRTPLKIADGSPDCMEALMPSLYKQLCGIMELLEKHFREMQDIEFTYENNVLFMLQTRTGKRTSRAALRIAVDLCKEGVISEQEAIKRVEPESMAQLLASEFDEAAKQRILAAGNLLGKGLNAGPGAATGKLVLTADKALELAAEGEDVILVRAETSPEDIEGMHTARGILTQRGGMTSHAAVVARGMGKPCVVGCSQMIVDPKNNCIRFTDRVLKEGEPISIDGTTGEVILGEIPTEESHLVRQLKAGERKPGTQGEEFSLLREWVSKHTKMLVRANADTPEDAAFARLLGAEGIGLCRTEHMFFQEDRILHIRRMILAGDADERADALNKLLPYQQGDFYELLKAMENLPVTIRLLDPPLHEFLPQTEELMEELARNMNVTPSVIKRRVNDLHELNPMLGHRGCRLGITHPEIYQMQVKAICNAAKQATDEGVTVKPEIMVPLIGSHKELDKVKESIMPIVEASAPDIPVGTMIEIPRAALTADEIAQSADFFSFGTNDLTQCGMGISRDDSGGFLPQYIDEKIIETDPFKSLDQDGIGKLVRLACSDGRATKPDIKLGVCGEHGGDPRSISFFYEAGLNYVSCSPFRVPIALLAAAQAGLQDD
ncbi:MAG: pyruvate, phosphate dikinase [Acidobacteriota bacterium]|nr:pyruvate, phosphate dikinase [Acidobacteriota bacterium]